MGRELKIAVTDDKLDSVMTDYAMPALDTLRSREPWRTFLAGRVMVRRPAQQTAEL